MRAAAAPARVRGPGAAWHGPEAAAERIARARAVALAARHLALYPAAAGGGAARESAAGRRQRGGGCRRWAWGAPAARRRAIAVSKRLRPQLAVQGRRRRGASAGAARWRACSRLQRLLSAAGDMPRRLARRRGPRAPPRRPQKPTMPCEPPPRSPPCAPPAALGATRKEAVRGPARRHVLPGSPSTAGRLVHAGWKRARRSRRPAIAPAARRQPHRPPPPRARASTPHWQQGSHSTMQATSACSRASVQFARGPSSRRAGCRAARLVVQAKVDLQGGPRKIRGKCFVTKDVSAPRRQGRCWGNLCPSGCWGRPSAHPPHPGLTAG